MRIALLAFLAALAMPGAAADNIQSAKAPSWYLEDIARLTADGGRWIADNSAYMSESEPFDAYGTEWVSGFDGDTMTGRLFGMKDGKELTFNFWEFRQYWHPGRQEAVVEQFGWGGALGVGALNADGAGTLSDQVFYNPDGTTTRTGHKSSFPNRKTHVTESFDIVGDEKIPRRKYVWKLQSSDKK